MKARKDRIGETHRNNQGLLMKIVEYRNNKDITVEFPQTAERRKTTYIKFRRGQVPADLLHYPIHTDCTFKQAKVYVIGIGLLIISTIGALIKLFL